MGDRSKASPPVTTDDLLELDAESGLSDSVVEAATKRKSDASSRASTKTSKKPHPTPPVKNPGRMQKKLASLLTTCLPKRSRKQPDGRKLQDTTKKWNSWKNRK